MFFFQRLCSLNLNYPEALRAQHPITFTVANQVTEELISDIKERKLSLLTPNAPDLINYDWKSYLNCSLVRMLKVSDLIEKLGPNLKILDVGSYFGNFALFCSRLGHTVDVVDNYKDYAESLNFVTDKLKKNKIEVHEILDVGYDLSGLAKESYDVVLCLSVIEHIPHTPRFLMQALSSVLKNSGHLILETPNLAYVYNRQKLMRGSSVHPPIQSQYFTQLPFQGHHREYTIDEIQWILEENQFSVVNLDTYLYSLYGLPHLKGIDLINFAKMQLDMTSRELIIALAKKNR